MQRYIYSFLFSLFTILGFISCESDMLEGEWSKTRPVDYYFSVDKQNLDLGYAASSEVISVKTNGAWTASSELSWISISPSSGNGEAQISISIPENNSETERVGEITIKGQQPNNTAKIRISQKGKNFNFSVDKDSIGSSSAAFSDLITITTNDEWTIAADKDWLSLSVSSGKGEGNVNINVLENKTPEARIAMISIKGKNSETTASVKVVQDGKFLKIDANSLNFSNDGGSKTVIISTDGTYSVSQEGEWFVVSQIGDTLTVTAEKNIATSINSGSIVVAMTDLSSGSLSQIITVKQGATDYNFSVDNTSITSDYSANSTLFTITTNDEWTITTSDSWITVSSSSGSGDRDITVNLSENTSTTSRSGSITISGKNSGESAIINVSQEYKKETITVDGYENGYAYVDLGLPSGILWATCNIGAEKPEDYGYFFAWGETIIKNEYSWSSYKYCNGLESTLAKYNIDSSYGIVDRMTVLEIEDDAAHVNWGGSWRMPTKEEQDELRNINNCIWTWTTQNGVNGYIVTSKKNNNSLFLPAAGWCGGSAFGGTGSNGNYFSLSLNTSDPESACCLSFTSSEVYRSNGKRHYGRSVRPVFKEKETVVYFLELNKSAISVDFSSSNDSFILSTNDFWSITTDVDWVSTSLASGNGNSTIDVLIDVNSSSNTRMGTITVKSNNGGDKTIIVTQAGTPDSGDSNGKENGHEYVDLGLPSGVLWATCNVGATNPEDNGDYFAWGETSSKSTTYDWSDYKWGNGNMRMTKYCIDTKHGTVDYLSILDLEDDVAHAKWDGRWRMPTKAEQDELRQECLWTWTVQGGVSGYMVKSKKNDNSIFLPAAGFRSSQGLGYVGESGYYWSSTLLASYSSNAYRLVFDMGSSIYWSDLSRCCGLSIRPVFKEKETVTYFLELNKSKMSVDFSSSNESFSFCSNDSWLISTDVNWISLSLISGNGGNTVDVSIDENTSSNYRTGTITVKTNNSGNKTISVTQIGKPDSGIYGDGLENDHAYVDLGLPSGILWATCNIGANNPEEYGDYYSWGATSTQQVYDWVNTPYQTQNTTDRTLTKFTKYLGSTTSSFKDSSAKDEDALKKVLDPEDDAAHVHWGGKWRIPTVEEHSELVRECIWTWTTMNGVEGCLITSKKNYRTIFLPAAGSRFDSSLGTGYGNYWLSSIDTNAHPSPNYAVYISFGSDYSGFSVSNRSAGRSIRPVCMP